MFARSLLLKHELLVFRKEEREKLALCELLLAVICVIKLCESSPGALGFRKRFLCPDVSEPLCQVLPMEGMKQWESKANTKPCCTPQCSNHIQLLKRKNSINPETAWFSVHVKCKFMLTYFPFNPEGIAECTENILSSIYIFYVPCKSLCCGTSGLLLARVGSRMELWDTLVQVQLCHPLDPGDGNTSMDYFHSVVFLYRFGPGHSFYSSLVLTQVIWEAGDLVNLWVFFFLPVPALGTLPGLQVADTNQFEALFGEKGYLISLSARSAGHGTVLSQAFVFCIVLEDEEVAWGSQGLEPALPQHRNLMYLCGSEGAQQTFPAAQEPLAVPVPQFIS
ncbi:hypothetical protein EK904_002722 [Melospiza melodia maxima]|nr:hypothetical protein EK904_002722 [Melospiza melodia maxima]